MPIPNLASFDQKLNRITADVLGETISYAANGATFQDVPALVDYTEDEQAFGGSTVIDQDMTVKVLIEDVPAEPDSNARVRLPRVAGKTFRPVNVKRTEDGFDWWFGLREVPGG